MADNDIIQGLIDRPGQSQQERTAPELDIHFADVDERTTAELLRLAGKLARRVNYFRDTVHAPSGDWTAFFPEDANVIARLLAGEDGATSPHLALFISFLRMYQLPQEVINRITGRHLNFYYRRVLQLEKRPAEPDRAHLVVELKKQAEPVALTPEHRFSAGKDAAGTELIYAPTGTTVINHARVAALHTLSVGDNGKGPVSAATPVPGTAWPPFGAPGTTPAPVGFAITTPDLLMGEGERTVTVSFTFDVPPKHPLASCFSAQITGEKGWLDAAVSAGTGAGGMVVSLPAGSGAVAGFGPVHGGYRFPPGVPVLLFTLDQTEGTAYGDLKGVQLSSVSVTAGVTGVMPDGLESDAGRLDPKKAFLPFGPLPTKGSRFMIGCREALAKRLATLTLDLRWKDLPDLAAIYADYGIDDVTAAFTASASFRDAGDVTRATGLSLFVEQGLKRRARAKKPPRGKTASFAEGVTLELLPGTHGGSGAPAGVDGFVTLFLDEGFRHDAYRQQYVAELARYAKDGGTLALPPEPYTPTVQAISLSYRTAPAVTAFAEGGSAEVTLHHVDCFGTMPVSGNRPVPLLPQHRSPGEILIGLAPLDPGDSVSLLFQVEEGSGDPEASRGTISWSVLSGNRWQALEDAAVTRNSTNGLRRSGVMTFAIPPAASLDNTLMTPGLVWLKGEMARGTAAADLLLAVAANAVEVGWVPTGNASSHLATALPAKSIAKPVTPIPAVKGISQPFPSFGGRAEEDDGRFHTRVAERLRHKERCQGSWDWERVVLEAFPRLHRVKCLPHARKGNYLAPGNVLLVVIPDQRHRSGSGVLQPRADADTLTAVKAFVTARAGMGVTVEVQNPVYREVRLSFAVRFRQPDFNYCRQQLDEALVRFLSPWAFDTDREVTFGGIIYKSVLVDFMEELAYVDFVTDVRMTAGGTADLDQVRPDSPDTILVSAASHQITPVTGGTP